jgi:ubiquinone/menaquinone biosynthesis C-methylase UbiE
VIISIGSKVRYHNFGYIPSGKLSEDMYGKVFGHRNLIKRLQALDIIRALKIKPDDVVLDFGCGAGYITIELAKLGRKVYGIDINPYLNTINIPKTLEHVLQFIVVSGDTLPFKDQYVDKVLASEILPMITDPALFLKELNRVLKPGGVLVVSNGAGHPAVKDGYTNKNIIFRCLSRIYKDRLPSTYDEYCEILQKSFGTGRKNFIEEAEMCELLSNNGFKVESISYTPGMLVGSYYSWSQFRLYLRSGKTLSQKYFAAKFIFWSVIKLFEWKNYKGGLLCVARKI